MVEYLPAEFLCIPFSVQNQTASRTHGAVHHLNAGAQLLPDQLRQLHLPRLLPGGNVVTGMLRGFFADEPVNLLHRIVQINHGEGPSLIGGYLSRLQCLPAHPEAGILPSLPLLGHPVQMAEAQDHRVRPLGPAVVGAGLLPLGQGHGPESLGRYWLLLPDVVYVGRAEHLLGGEIQEAPLLHHAAGGQDVHEPRHVPHAVLPGGLPGEIGVISAGEYGHVRLHALQDVLDAPAVIGEIVFLEDAAVGELPLFLPRQQIDPMAILVQLVNHSVHQRAAAAYQ